MPFSPPSHKPLPLVGSSRHVVAVAEKIYRLWYKRRMWTHRLRPQTMLRDGFSCQMCGRNWGHETSRLVVDHKKPHRGVWELFCDPENLWSLCDHPCHNRHKQREEQNM